MEEFRARINNIIPFSSVDGLGNRTVIFFQGCNLNCSYCHNKETINLCENCGVCIESCKSKAISYENNKVIFNEKPCLGCDSCINVCPNNSTPKTKLMTVTEVFNEIEKYSLFINGITVSGGECTLWSGFLIELFKKCKEKGLSCLIDSNGFNSFEKMSELLDLSDGVMLDIKAWNKDIHKKEIGKSNEFIKENFLYLLKKDKLREVRTVVVDGFNNEETVEEVSKVLGSLNSSVTYKLIKFRNHGVRKAMKNKEVPTDNYMRVLEKIARKNGCNDILIV